jgi:uncharacterized membrane protein YkoI
MKYLISILSACTIAFPALAFTGETTTAPWSDTGCPHAEQFPPLNGQFIEAIAFACIGILLALLTVFVLRARKSMFKIGCALVIVGIVAITFSFFGPTKVRFDGPDPSYFVAKEAIKDQCGGAVQLKIVAKYNGNDTYEFISDTCVDPVRVRVKSKTHEVFDVGIDKYASSQISFSQSDWKISGAQAWALARPDIAIYGIRSEAVKFLAMLLERRGGRLEWSIDFETRDGMNFDVHIDATTGEKLGSSHFAYCA